jgi:hypothetical protein
MPAGLLPSEGIGAQLEYILSAPITGVLSWLLVLFVNDLVPDADTVFADLVEASWPGYSRLQLARDGWTTPTVWGGCATSTWGTEPLVYNVGPVSPGVINYGAAYFDGTTGLLRWVQRFDDADLFALVPGGQFSLLPTYTLTSAEC